MGFKITKDQIILAFVIIVGLMSIQVYFRRGLTPRIHISNDEELNLKLNQEPINSIK